MNDKLRFAIMSVVTATFPMLTLLGIVELSGEQVAAIEYFIVQVLLLVALVFPQGQQPA